MFKNWSLRFWPRPVPVSAEDYKIIAAVLQWENKTATMKDEEIKANVQNLRNQIAEGIPAEKFIEKGFALVREAAWRTTKMKHYNVQMLAGISLFRGAFAEMATGEGKTLTATLPAFMWALHGRGVHVQTTNSYLAQRDFELMKPVYEFLDMSVGLLSQGDPPAQKKEAYNCDITYGVGSDYGFDYMRDQMAILNSPQPKLGKSFMSSMYGYKKHPPFKMQRDLAFALIDEVDSVLLDEARSPLVISGSQSGQSKDAHIYQIANQIAKKLEKDKDFTIDKSKKAVDILDDGKKKIYEQKIPKGLVSPWSFYIRQALNAHNFFHKNVHYMVDDGKVVIVDEYTGRRFAERTWRDGLHQAIEAKEKLMITEASKSLAKITRQRYFSFYEKIAGMTGTAQGSEKEIWQFYKAPVVCIPPRKTRQRKELKDRIFGSLESKWEAVTKKVLEIHKQGQPVLIGTKTIANSEKIAAILQKQKLTVTVLNAKQDAEEATIISKAGQKGSITIATNMAGRGTDIHLGEGTEDLGGLFVLGTERHESRRVDNQLLGRCGRQGNVGISQFFISFEDDLIVQHMPNLTERFKDKAELPSRYANVFEKLQQRLDSLYFQQRKTMFRFDNWVEEVLKMIG